MGDAAKVRWEGKSGQKYTYSVYTRKDELPEGPCNYIYASEHSPGQWQPIYIGETAKPSRNMLDTHPERDCIILEGATHIHHRPSSESEENRRQEVEDLIAKWTPECNA